MDFLDKLKTHLSLKQEILDYIGFSGECTCPLTDNTDQPWKRSDYKDDGKYTRIYQGKEFFAVGYYKWRYDSLDNDEYGFGTPDDKYEMDIYELKFFNYTKEIK